MGVADANRSRRGDNDRGQARRLARRPFWRSNARTVQTKDRPPMARIVWARRGARARLAAWESGGKRRAASWTRGRGLLLLSGFNSLLLPPTILSGSGLRHCNKQLTVRAQASRSSRAKFSPQRGPVSSTLRATFDAQWAKYRSHNVHEGTRFYDAPEWRLHYSLNGYNTRPLARSVLLGFRARLVQSGF